MSANDIPEQVREFLSRNIGTVNELEVLLMLMQVRREWRVQEVGERMYLDQESARAVLSALVASGLIEGREEDPDLYHYTASGNTDAIIQTLAETYARMRVRVIELIYHSPNRAIRSFADAFKLTKDPE